MFVRKNYYLYAENAENRMKKETVGKRKAHTDRRAVDNGNPVEGRK